MLTTDTLDLALNSSGDLIVTGGDMQISSGEDGVAKLIRIAILLFRGEWFLNLDAGVPYLERQGVPASEAIMGQAFDKAKIESAFRDAILGVSGVAQVTSLAATYVSSTRTLNVAWTVQTTFGGTVTDFLAQGL